MGGLILNLINITPIQEMYSSNSFKEAVLKKQVKRLSVNFSVFYHRLLIFHVVTLQGPFLAADS